MKRVLVLLFFSFVVIVGCSKRNHNNSVEKEVVPMVQVTPSIKSLDYHLSIEDLVGVWAVDSNLPLVPDPKLPWKNAQNTIPQGELVIDILSYPPVLHTGVMGKLPIVNLDITGSIASIQFQFRDDNLYTLHFEFQSSDRMFIHNEEWFNSIHLFDNIGKSFQYMKLSSPKEPSFFITKSTIPFFQEPSFESEQVGVLNKGVVVELVSFKMSTVEPIDFWVFIKVNTEKQGYVLRSNLNIELTDVNRINERNHDLWLIDAYSPDFSAKVCKDSIPVYNRSEKDSSAIISTIANSQVIDVYEYVTIENADSTLKMFLIKVKGSDIAGWVVEGGFIIEN